MDYNDLSLDDVLALLVTHENFAKTTEEMHQNQVIISKSNFAFKAKYEQTQESIEDEDDGEDEEYFKKVQEGLENLPLMAKDFQSRGARKERFNKRSSSQRQSCYNCGDSRNFVANCPNSRRPDFEVKEEKNPKPNKPYYDDQ